MQSDNQSYSTSCFNSVQKGEMHSLFLLATYILTSLPPSHQQIDIFSTQGCSVHCPPPNPKNIIDGFVLHDVLQLPFLQICKSLSNETKPSSNFNQILKTSTANFCQNLFKSELKQFIQNHENFAPEQLQGQPIEKICNFDSDKNSSNPENINYFPFVDEECTQVCPGGNRGRPEDIVIHGGFLEHLRKDSLRDICKNLLIANATKSANVADGIVVGNRAVAESHILLVNSAQSYLEWALSREKDANDSMTFARKELEEVQSRLETAKSGLEEFNLEISLQIARNNVLLMERLAKVASDVRVGGEKRLLGYKNGFEVVKNRVKEAEEYAKNVREMTRKFVEVLENVKT